MTGKYITLEDAKIIADYGKLKNELNYYKSKYNEVNCNYNKALDYANTIINELSGTTIEEEQIELIVHKKYKDILLGLDPYEQM